ncbi:TetR/AcrR family transcriptional regulator [Acetobacter cerevisiae]|uniref:TetR family transcriptional regulator n=1 Tax=Acetobacter cerevisiae TaxID=178900 RepID=A0A149QF40_9PROT|nr:TetR/AcrR family transcriptional regulator [Acetobacter cerevisiae]KXU95912.1 TetR family transcriptional regulator [Acetobacter cerevisiae]KXV72494.1 TetR family transcriptional regulator [Acetobacter cerevisiae]KXV77035.1 TetR family transcriptional regulator [Acetobacter cerevisiae]MCP1244986.1 TetR/AcrR family transcriptional regulator [Acetobacter cerevisiae]MCP1254563.1 TetR/AcrR family transcriptional regulator [Acetobacter cerevisiae]
MSVSPSKPVMVTHLCTGESEAKRQQILTGAKAVFAAHGFEGASMSAIAREAGVSKGTLYNYFANKCDLFAAFVEKNCREKLEVLAPVQKLSLSPEKTLTALAREIIRLIISPESLMLYRIIVSEAPHFPHLATTFWQSGPKRAIETLSGWIEGQVAQGTLNVDDPVFAAEQFFSLCQTRIAHRKRFNMPFDNEAEDEEKVIHAAVRMFLAAYGVKPSEAPAAD